MSCLPRSFQLKHSGTIIMFFDAHRWAGISKPEDSVRSPSEMRKYCWPRSWERRLSPVVRPSQKHVEIYQHHREATHQGEQAGLISLVLKEAGGTLPHYQHWSRYSRSPISPRLLIGVSPLCQPSAAPFSSFLTVPIIQIWYVVYMHKPDHLCNERD